MWECNAYKIVKSTLTQWEVEKGNKEVVAIYAEGITPAYCATVTILLNMYQEYVVKLTLRFANRLSASCGRVARTDEELGSVLEKIGKMTSNQLFIGLEEKLGASMKEYMYEVEGQLF